MTIFRYTYSLLYLTMTILLSEDEWVIAYCGTIPRFVKDISYSFFEEFFGDDMDVFDIAQIIDMSLPEFVKFLYRIYKIFVNCNFFHLWKNVEMHDDIISQAFRYGDKSFFGHYSVLKKFGNVSNFDFDSVSGNVDSINVKYNTILVNYLCSMFG